MDRHNLVLVVVGLFTTLSNCNHMDASLTLDIPEKEFEVVQHLPANHEGRARNPLYLPPRRIDDAEFNTNKLNVFIDSMYAVMVKKSGVGIAANQLGKRLQIFIIEAKADNPRYKILGPVPKQIFVNPKITAVAPTRKNFWHGCLSANGEKRGNVATYEWLEYEAQNEKGEMIKGRLDGFAAVVFQHEFKHLMNGTYMDVAHQFVAKSELDQKTSTGELPFFEVTSDTLPLLLNGYVVGQTLDAYHHQ